VERRVICKNGIADHDLNMKISKIHKFMNKRKPVIMEVEFNDTKEDDKVKSKLVLDQIIAIIHQNLEHKTGFEYIFEDKVRSVNCGIIPKFVKEKNDLLEDIVNNDSLS
jgi:translation initiation factor IF-3